MGTWEGRSELGGEGTAFLFPKSSRGVECPVAASLLRRSSQCRVVGHRSNGSLSAREVPLQHQSCSHFSRNRNSYSFRDRSLLREPEAASIELSSTIHCPGAGPEEIFSQDASCSPSFTSLAPLLLCTMDSGELHPAVPAQAQLLTRPAGSSREKRGSNTLSTPLDSPVSASSASAEPKPKKTRIQTRESVLALFKGRSQPDLQWSACKGCIHDVWGSPRGSSRVVALSIEECVLAKDPGESWSWWNEEVPRRIRGLHSDG